MGADIKKLRNRIKSVDSTLHLTKAMGLVASSKIRRATDAMNKGRAYRKAVQETVDMLTQCPEARKSPYMAVRETGRTRLIVVAGDRGMAGGYNANVFRMAKGYPDAEIIPIGKRSVDRFGGETLYAEKFDYAAAHAMAEKLCADFAAGEFDRLGVISTSYKSMMTQETVLDWILPLEKAENAPTKSILFEPDELTILNAAVPEYVAGTILALVRESFTSEVAARRTAMDSAGKNAQEMIDGLQLTYNQARQSAITQEITEIVAGSGN